MLDVLLIVLVTFLVLNNNKRVSVKYKLPPKFAAQFNYVYFYHIVFIILFSVYISATGGDAKAYWNMTDFSQFNNNKGILDYYGLGTDFMLFLCYIPSKILKLHFLTGNFLFGTLGFIGIRYIMLLCYVNFTFTPKTFFGRAFPALFYLPNMHFWTSGVGKDSLCFWGIAGLFYFYHFGKNKLHILLAFIIVIFHTRPYIAYLLTFAFITTLLFSSKVKLPYKILFIAVSVGGAFLMLDKLTSYLKISEFSQNSIENYASSRATVLSGKGVGSSIDISNYNEVFRLFSYFFRPLFFDANSFFSLILSLENFIYIYIFIKTFKYLRFKNIRKMPPWANIAFVFFILSAITFANSLGNLGIIMRMKNMSMIYGLIFFLLLESINKTDLIKDWKLRQQMALTDLN